MLEKLTVAIKTIHRPWACHRLIQSLDRYAPGVKIHVLDDGHPKHRFSSHHPETAARCDRLPVNNALTAVTRRPSVFQRVGSG